MGNQPAVQVLSSIGVILDGFDPATVGAGERLGCARQARRLASRLTAVAGLLLADAEAAKESMRAAATPTTTWMAIDSDLSKRKRAGRYTKPANSANIRRSAKLRRRAGSASARPAPSPTCCGASTGWTPPSRCGPSR